MRFIILALVLIPISAHAEASDKILSIIELWGFGIVVTLIFTFLVRIYRMAALVGILVIGLYAYTIADIVDDPFVGPAVLEEQGVSYLIASYGSITLIALGVAFGVFLNFKRNQSAL